MIGHTQPRRIAARTVAARIAEELGVPLGAQVGYAVRFTDRSGPDTHIRVLTDGILLNEIERDPLLLAYDTVIVDEAHERSLNIDFLLGYLRRLIDRRDDLQVIVTSATIDVARFSQHFADAPVVEIGGRGFPVDIVYLAEDIVVAAEDRALDERIGDVVSAILEEDARRPGLRAAPDILVFLAGERDILEVARSLRKASFREPIDVLPLYARLPQSEQERIFQPGGQRRVVLATNVAETSLTVPRIGYVIDPGLARISRYSVRSKLQRLPIEPISQASANQRAGRCGRIAPGVCFRLYSEADFHARPAFTDAEILRTNLASVVLQSKLLELGDLNRFPLLDRPEQRAINDAHGLLRELSALAGDALTPLGRRMARLPVDPRLARMLLAAIDEGVVAEVLVIVAGLAIADPRERPQDARAAADASHAEWRHPDSDFASFLSLWRWFVVQREALSRSALRRLCRERYLSPLRMQEWRDIHRQLTVTLTSLGVRVPALPEECDLDRIHRAVLAGCLGQVGMRKEARDYLGAHNKRFGIFPGSALARRTPPWVMASEIVETQRVLARCVAAIDPAWLERVGAHLLRRQHSEPRWSRKRGEAVAFERATLYGLPIYERRVVRLAPLDAATARELFLRDGLVAGDIERPPEPLRANMALLAELRSREEKLRRRDLLVDERQQAAFYDERLPPELCDMRSFARWLRHGDNAARITMVENDIALVPVALREAEFPGSLTFDGVSFVVQYRFAPGAADDGIALQVPLGLLPHLEQRHLDYLVPGYFAARLLALLRGLPRAARRPLVPMEETIATLRPLLAEAEVQRSVPLATLLARLLRERWQLVVSPAVWASVEFEPHCTFKLEVRDAAGRLLVRGTDLVALQQRFALPTAGGAADAWRRSHEQPVVERFPDDGVPTRRVLGDGDRAVVAFPALRVEGDHVALRVFDSADAAAAAHALAVAVLAFRALGKPGQRLLEGQAEWGAAQLRYAPLAAPVSLLHSLQHALASALVPAGLQSVREPGQFAALVARLRSDGGAMARDLVTLAARLLRLRSELVQICERLTSPAYAAAIGDALAWLQRRVPAELFLSTPIERLPALVRLMEGELTRLRSLQGRVQRDTEHCRELAGLWDSLVSLRRGGTEPAVVETLSWEFDELRATLLAPGYRPAVRTSTTRLARQLAEWQATGAERGTRSG